MGLVHHPNVVTDGLVGCWDAGNRRSYPGTGTTWTGLGVNAPAILGNGVGFADINKGVITFDGTDEKVNVANTTDIDGAGGFTFDIWLYFLAMPDSDYTVFSLHNSGGGSGEEFTFWIMDPDEHTNSVRAGKRKTTGGVGTNRRSTDAALGPAANIGKWANWTFTYSGGDSAVYSSYKIYYNGEEKDDGSTGGAGNDGSANANQWGLDRNDYGDFNGYMGRVAFYNRALSADEVLQNYKATKSRFAPRITKSGLVGNWDAGDPASYVGGDTCKDTANGTASTLKNMDGSNFNSSNGGYWEFDGTNEYIQCSTDSVLQPQSFSVEAWVKDDQTEHYLPIVAWANAYYPAVWTSYHDSTQKPIIYMGGPDLRYFDATAASVAGWHHVVFTYTYDDITTSAFYVDGVSIAVSSTYDDTKASTNTCTIGAALKPSGPQYYQGSMGLVRIYDTPLSAAEILDNYNKTKGRFT